MKIKKKSNKEVKPFNLWLKQLKRDIEKAKETAHDDDELIKLIEGKDYNEGKGYKVVYPETFKSIYGLSLDKGRSEENGGEI